MIFINIGIFKCSHILIKIHLEFRVEALLLPSHATVPGCMVIRIGELNLAFNGLGEHAGCTLLNTFEYFLCVARLHVSYLWRLLLWRWLCCVNVDDIIKEIVLH